MASELLMRPLNYYVRWPNSIKEAKALHSSRIVFRQTLVMN